MVYVLVAIVRKRLNLELSLHEMLQILSITPFDKTPMIQLFTYSATITGREQAEALRASRGTLSHLVQLGSRGRLFL
jgi:hypothetical protein